MKDKIIEKYIKRIKIDYPEDDKIYGDLMGFATEIETALKEQMEQDKTHDMECPYNKKGCIKVDTSGMDKIPCEECEIFIQFSDKQNEFMMGL